MASRKPRALPSEVRPGQYRRAAPGKGGVRPEVLVGGRSASGLHDVYDWDGGRWVARKRRRAANIAARWPTVVSEGNALPGQQADTVEGLRAEVEALKNERVALHEQARTARDTALEEAATEAEALGRGWGVLRSMKMTEHANAAAKVAAHIRSLKSEKQP